MRGRYFWFDCSCVEAGSVLGRENWIAQAATVRQRKISSFDRCSAVVRREARILGSWEETLPVYGPYIYRFVHFAFAAKQFPSKRAAVTFLAHALDAFGGDALLRPYVKDSAVRVLEIRKDGGTRKTRITVKEDHREEALLYSSAVRRREDRCHPQHDGCLLPRLPEHTHEVSLGAG